MSYFRIENLSFTLENNRKLFSEINLHLEKSKIGAVLGSSGSGKTSLLRCIAGLEKPDTGRILFEENSESIDITQKPPFKRDIGFMFQSAALFPNLTVKENILFGIQKLPKNEKQNRLEQMLDLTRMSEQLNKFPDSLSGGEKQRIALARALAPAPKLLLMDEPFSGLDPDLKENLRSDLLEILRRDGTSVLLVTHDHQEAYFLADYIGVLAAGRLKFWQDKFSAFQVTEEKVPKLISFS